MRGFDLIYFIYQNKEFKKQIEYTMETISHILLYKNQYNILPYRSLKEVNIDNDIIVSYGKTKPKDCFKNHIHIYESNFFGKNYLHVESLPIIPLKRYGELPIIYGGNEIKKATIQKNGRKCKIIETDIDIIASSFFMLTRYEEILIKERNKFDGFPAIASLAYKENFLDRPIVNEYIELLWSWIKSFKIHLKKKELWHGKRFAIALTHDVDKVSRYSNGPPIFSIGRALSQKNYKDANKFIIDYILTKIKIKKHDEYYNFESIMSLEKEHGFSSSFYFLPDNYSSVYRADYRIDSKIIKNAIRILEDKGFEVGYHAGFFTYNNEAIFNREKENLENVVKNNIWGGRQHYLRWSTPITWRLWEKAGFDYDSTLGFSKLNGFRCGICHPFKPFDVLEERIIDIYELPLMVMDTTLFGSLQFSVQSAEKYIRLIMNKVQEYRGVLVLLFHNSSFSKLYFPNRLTLYSKLLKIFASNNILVSNSKRLIDLWKDYEKK